MAREAVFAPDVTHREQSGVPAGHDIGKAISGPDIPGGSPATGKPLPSRFRRYLP